MTLLLRRKKSFLSWKTEQPFKKLFYTLTEGFTRKNIGKIKEKNYVIFRIPKNQSIVITRLWGLEFSFSIKSFKLALFAREGRKKLVNSSIIDYF